MFDIGFWELLVIAVVLLLVLGPERLPDVAKQAAFFVRKMRQGMFRLRNEMQSEIDSTPFADLQKARQEMNDFKDDIKQLGRELADSVEEKIDAGTTAMGISQEDSQAVIAVDDPAVTKVDKHDAAQPKPPSRSALNAKNQQAGKIAGKKTSKKVAKKVSKKLVKKVAKKATKKVVKKVVKKEVSKQTPASSASD